jgi:hypothetical protein
MQLHETEQNIMKTLEQNIKSTNFATYMEHSAKKAAISSDRFKGMTPEQIANRIRKEKHGA